VERAFKGRSGARGFADHEHEGTRCTQAMSHERHGTKAMRGHDGAEHEGHEPEVSQQRPPFDSRTESHHPGRPLSLRSFGALFDALTVPHSRSGGER